MSAVDTLFLDDFDTVASPSGPVIDGFFFEDIGMPEPAPETGYIRGGRYTWSGGAEPMGLALFRCLEPVFARFGSRTRPSRLP